MTDARAARDAGIATVLSNSYEWRDKVRARIRQLSPGWIGTGEDIRVMLEAEGLVPHHHNAWGGVIHGCVKDGLLRWTGELTQMYTEQSHARSTKVYERVVTAREMMHAALMGSHVSIR